MRRVTIAFTVFGACCVAAPVLFIVAIAADAGAGAVSFRNVSQSMEPTLFAGELFTARPVPGGSPGAIPRGVLVAHRFPPDPEKEFVKRIVGVPGDTIQMVNGVVYIDDRALAEPYAWRADSTSDPVWEDFKWQRDYLTNPTGRDASHYRPSRNNWGPILVPAGHYVVLGDNRDNSLDSRFWGFITTDDIIGFPRRVYFSRVPRFGRVRWTRIGHRLN